MAQNPVMSGDRKAGDGKEWRRPTGAEEPPPRDGRAARAVRTRNAVADALLELIEEGQLRPTSKAIAERAAVSERTIFQHFEDLETLFSAASARVGDRVVRDLQYIPDDGPFEGRLAAYLDELVVLHEEMSPLQRASTLHEPFSPVLGQALGWWHDLLRRGIERVFRCEIETWPEGERSDVVESVALTVEWSNWENMRTRSQFEPDRARRLLELSIRALLRQPTPPPPPPPAD